ncbi:hypothetical protein EWH23_11940 [Meiothermus sp. PNK-Is4]|uniref:hypothetical protein n=1 Tax=Meiothermus sp. PNK-Is4 TaxID=2740565 RepID=UPI001021D0F3|nr:hypothetical protein [Meiothermus sp. PNK-Is4]RYM35311.1 hypothetical protein EWH23_11940 [Meiothermus sp. PNK-Is4]
MPKALEALAKHGKLPQPVDQVSYTSHERAHGWDAEVLLGDHRVRIEVKQTEVEGAHWHGSVTITAGTAEKAHRWDNLLIYALVDSKREEVCAVYCFLPSRLGGQGLERLADFESAAKVREGKAEGHKPYYVVQLSDLEAMADVTEKF